MSVDFDAFVDWATARFGDILVKGAEVKLNSIFIDDHGHHLWCSPDGGKHKRKDGCYRCFKTESKGTLIGLVMHVDSCSYKEAKETLSGISGKMPFRLVEKEIERLYAEGGDKPVPPPPAAVAMPESSWLINSLPDCSLERQESEAYLKSRKLSSSKLYVCVSGEYANRIIIPYYDRDGKLIYWNSRALGKCKGNRYQGPKKDCGVGKLDVVYMTSWPKAGKVYVTEGEFDAMSLAECSLVGAACGGKTMGDAQMLMLKNYQICLTLDGDSAGYDGLLGMSRKLMRFGLKNISFVRPPVGYKDWNAMLIDLGDKVMRGYIDKCEKPFDSWTISQLQWGRI